MIIILQPLDVDPVAGPRQRAVWLPCRQLLIRRRRWPVASRAKLANLSWGKREKCFLALDLALALVQVAANY